MTYFDFLLKFLAIPLVILLVMTLIDRRQNKPVSGFLSGRSVWLAICLHVLLALLYTTPWDNYLVATRVWYYNKGLISGIILGWVPIEEYCFFVLETFLTGLWWWYLIRKIKVTSEFRPRKNTRVISTTSLGAAWILCIMVFISGWKPGTYLSLIVAWALPPIMLQLAYGADILWHNRKLIALAIVPVFLYISTADAIAISSGIWTINSARSLGFLIGPLPIEEAVFFLSTTMIIVFGLALFLAEVGQLRWRVISRNWVNRTLRIYSRISSHTISPEAQCTENDNPILPSL
jgi:lycopene cyclase domain-containing protein